MAPSWGHWCLILMSNSLVVKIGQYSSRGLKPENQDYLAHRCPLEPWRTTKGVCVAIADGISSSEVSAHASQTAINGFIEDYYATPESWSTKTSAEKVLLSINAWLYSQTRSSSYRYNMDKGFVCTFSGLIFKSHTAHVFHAGDSRVIRIRNNSLETLTHDHRLWVSEEKSYLSNALGMREKIEIDHLEVGIEIDDIFILCTDGIYEFLSDTEILTLVQNQRDNLDDAAQAIADHALRAQSDDNLSIAIAKVTDLPQESLKELHRSLDKLPFPPDLKQGMVFDGYELLRELHHNHRSHIFLAKDLDNQSLLVLKAPAVDLRSESTYLESFLSEDWIARRLNNAHLMKAYTASRPANYLYLTTEYIQGQTLAQWLRDTPMPTVEQVRDIIEQVAKGLYALHHLEMLHQDLRPENIMIDDHGTVTIIDYGSVSVAGLEESYSVDVNPVRGTILFTPPECFLGELATLQSEIYSLGTLVYFMFGGTTPYGTSLAKATSRSAQLRLTYPSLYSSHSPIPQWVDAAIKKAVQPEPHKRYDAISEFIYDLRHPNKQFVRTQQTPLIERHPVRFWQALCVLLLILLLWVGKDHPALNSNSSTPMTSIANIEKTIVEINNE